MNRTAQGLERPERLAGYYRVQTGPPDRTAGGEEECPERSALAGAWGLSTKDTSE